MAEPIPLAQRGHFASRRDADIDDDVLLVPATSVRATPIRWLWRGWLARGKLHVLAGSPGTGKTTIALSLAATITNGGYLPDGSRAVPGNVLVWSGEDDPGDTLKPRLAAAGANMRRVFFVGDVGIGEESRPFDPSRDMAGLERAAEAIGNVALLVADPVVSAVSGDSHKNTEVRRALQPLINLASRIDCAVLGISHFSKGTAGRDPLERVTGSIAFGAVARIVMATAKSEDGNQILARAKSNIGPDGGGFAYDLSIVVAEEIETSCVAWGSALEGTARELLGDAEDVGDSPRDDAADWLADMLSGAEVAVTDLKKQAAAAGFGWRTIERVKSDVGAVAERVSDGNAGKGRWCWRMVGKSASPKTATSTTGFGGLAESEAGQGVEPSQDRKTATPQCVGVVADLPGEVTL